MPLFNGTSGNDQLFGGKADDTFVGSAGNDTIDGGDLPGAALPDTVDYSAFSTPLVVNLAGAQGSVSTTGKLDVLIGIEAVLGGSAADVMTAGPTTLLLSGRGGNDTLNGSTGSSTLDGGAGDDLLNGGSGNETLFGGAGDDTLDGGAGTDWASYANASAAVQVQLGSGGAAGSATGGDGNDVLRNIEAVIGSTFNDTLVGSSGNDILDGGRGNDLLQGGDGDDIFQGLNSGDTVEGGAGFDAYEIAGNVQTEGLVVDLMGTAITFRSVEALYGGKGSGSRLLGDDGNNYLSGGSLVGRGGDDILIGETIDYGAVTVPITITPGLVNMLLPGTTRRWDVSATARIGATETDGFTARSLLLLGSGDDSISGASAAVWGTGAPPTIDGGAGNDRLVGLALIGGPGNDTLVGSLAIYDTAAGAITATLGVGTANGSASGEGNDVLVGITSLRGGALADVLTGNAMPNGLWGNAGNDRLVGLAGNDTLNGGAGDDSLEGGDGFDIASFEGATAAVTATLAGITGSATGTSIGNDTLLGIEGLRGTGFADRLTGNAEANLLWGGEGNDTLDGGAGPVTVIDVADYRGSLAVSANLVTGTVTRFNGLATETDTLSSIEGLLGSSEADTLRGADGNDVMPGERFRGGGGNDTINGGTGIDLAEFSGNLSQYTITRSAGSMNVSVAHNGGGVDGTDSLQSVELLMFADRLVAFGQRAEEVARVAFALWTPGIYGSATLFSKGISFYTNEFGYTLDRLCEVALLWHPETGLTMADKLKAAVPAIAFTPQQLVDIMNANGGATSTAGIAAAVKAVALDPAMTTQLELQGVFSKGVVATLGFPGETPDYFIPMPG